MALTVKKKIVGFALLATLLPVLVLLIFLLIQNNKVKKETSELLKVDAFNKLEKTSKDIYTMISLVDHKIKQNINHGIATIQKIAEQKGGIRLSDNSTEWVITNQFTKENKTIQLPNMMMGNQAFGQNKTFSNETPLVDEIKYMIGGTATIFQRVNDGGDMLRIATNVEKLDGTRAVGTYIPAVNPDGTQNKVVNTVLNGQTYKGKAYVVNAWYQTAYSPIYDNSGKVIGMYYVGYKQEDTDQLRKSIMDMKLGKTGYVWVLRGTGDDKGEYIISNNGEKDGVNIYNTKDSDGNLIIQEMIDKGLNLEPGAVDFHEYMWRDTENSAPRNKIVAISYYEPWDWVIGASAYEDEFYVVKDKFSESNASMITYMLIISAIIIIIMVIIALYVGNIIANPLINLAKASDKLADGELIDDIEVKSKDELLQLAKSFNSMKEKIRSMIDETNKLTKAASEGKLDYRANPDEFKGGFKEIIQGINNAMDNLIAPLNVTAEYVDRISKGDIPPKITDSYKGDFNEIKNNINNLIDNLQTFVNDMNQMYEEQKAGDIDSYIKAEKFQGSYYDMANGVNSLVKNQIDGVMQILETIKAYSENNFDHIMDEMPGKRKIANDYLNKLRNDFVSLTQEINDISANTLNGNLSFRGNSSKFEGTYRNIIQGINDTLDAVINPLYDTKLFLEKVGRGDDLEKYDTNKYKGDFVEIVQNMNILIDFLYGLIEDQAGTAKKILDGNSNERIDISKYPGGWNIITKGFNDALNAALSPTEAALESIKAMSEGDLTKYVEGDFKGDHAILKDSINNTLNALNEILGQVKTISEEVNKGSDQVAASSNNLSQGATQQAASIEEITSTMTEVGSQTKQNAENAGKANQYASQSKESSQKGNEEMKKLTSAMENINSSSSNIAKIIKVIDEIAFQTNLLALNAAVEAARAGVHGQGFAVVAEEVRNLAARSAKAAKETAELIEGSISTVKEGTDLTNKTAEVLDEIKNHSDDLAALISEIAEASNEQALAISQIRDGFTQIDDVVQQNTAGAEESASAAEQLSSQASNLQNMITKFRLKNTDSNLLSSNYNKKYLKSAEKDEDVEEDFDNLKFNESNDLDDFEMGKY